MAKICSKLDSNIIIHMLILHDIVSEMALVSLEHTGSLVGTDCISLVV